MVWKTTFALLISLLSFFAVSAQKATAYELNEYLSQAANNKSSINLKSSQSTSNPLQVLAYDLVSTVIIENGEIIDIALVDAVISSDKAQGAKAIYDYNKIINVKLKKSRLFNMLKQAAVCAT